MKRKNKEWKKKKKKSTIPAREQIQHPEKLASPKKEGGKKDQKQKQFSDEVKQQFSFSKKVSK